jgi:hypothetical protein
LENEDSLTRFPQEPLVHYNNHVKINFDSIESRLKSLVESSAHLIAGKPADDPRSVQLVAAVQAYIEKKSISGETILPDALVCEVPVAAVKSWQNYPFGETFKTILKHAGIPTATVPLVVLNGNVDLLDGEVVVSDAGPGSIPLDKTASMPSLTTSEDIFLSDGMPVNAFVIINGLDTISLNQPVVNIGRKLENDLVIEDQRISREHAQIRAVKGQYVIFDLNSTGGTFVNSVRITRQPLFPGDVISLAGVPLVYGQDSPLANTQTGPVEPFYTPPPEKGTS